jgi:chromosome partitioning protein
MVASSVRKKPYLIVLGNEKGGTGKSTVSMHLISHLLELGYGVGSIDVDARQGTLSRYLENRKAYINKTGSPLLISAHCPILRSAADTQKAAEQEETTAFQECLKRFSDMDFIVIDTPGTDSFLSRLAHSYADTLITPLNDSFIDLDMLARVTFEKREIEKPSTYAEMVWEQKKHRIMREGGKFDWVVLRNRLSSLLARNKEEMHGVLEKLAQRIGFRLASGFGERVIFRELFLSGLTLLDLPKLGMPLNLSHVAARQELRDLLEALKIPLLGERLKEAS